MKKIAVIPILLGSTRIPDKNLLMVDGYPMVFYVAEACKRAGVFDEIYLNSEHESFRRVADMLGCRFFKRNPQHGGSACTMKNKSRTCTGDRCQTHDHFLYNFMEETRPSHLAMVHTTSPLIQAETVATFMTKLESENYDSLFSVEERYTETFYGDTPLNFSLSRKIPTQTLPPIRLITWAVSAWKTESFMESYRRDDPNENGPTFCGKTGVFPMDRIQALDADTWDDLYMIQACLQFRRQKEQLGQFRFHDGIVNIEHNLEELIGRDGVCKFEASEANLTLRNIEEIKKKMGKPPWLYLLVYTADDQIALICQEPGEGARKHCHITHDEWWVVLEGAFEWRLGDGKVIAARQSDIVFLPRGAVHSIVCTSEKPGIRLACGARDMEHIYVR